MAAGKRALLSGELAAVALTVVVLSTNVRAASFPNPFSAGNAGIHLDPHITPNESRIRREGQPLVVLLGVVKDDRKDAPSRKVGDIRATVMFMAGNSLTLDQNVADVVRDALNNQLTADGYRTVRDPNVPHDFEIDSVVKGFELNIVDQDELNIISDMTLRNSSTGEVLWAGSVQEKSSRFAGVAGETKSSLIRYFARGLSNWAVKASANVSDVLLKIYPGTMTLVSRNDVATRPQLNGVKTLRTATPHEAANVNSTAPSVVAPASVVAPPGRAAPSTTLATTASTAAVTAPNSKGVFSVYTAPSRAKVYIDDVYFGYSPLKVELDPSVKLCSFKLEGYKTITEKVSIRPGETTELEVKFEK